MGEAKDSDAYGTDDLIPIVLGVHGRRGGQVQVSFHRYYLLLLLLTLF